MEQTTCEYDGDPRQLECQREEQCDDCFMIDHRKECEWCKHYDHPERKLEVKHLASDYPTDAPSVDDLLTHLEKQTGVRLPSKCAACGGMGYLGQIDANGDDIETVECPQCHPAFK